MSYDPRRLLIINSKVDAHRESQDTGLVLFSSNPTVSTAQDQRMAYIKRTITAIAHQAEWGKKRDFYIKSLLLHVSIVVDRYTKTFSTPINRQCSSWDYTMDHIFRSICTAQFANAVIVSHHCCCSFGLLRWFCASPRSCPSGKCTNSPGGRQVPW
jgi:hypothetical protein